MDLTQLALTIIGYAGESKSDAMSAIELVKTGEYKEAERLLSDSYEKMILAHKTHTEILTAEANAVEINMNFLLVHAANHLSVAEVTYEMASLFFETIKEVRKND